MTRFLSACMFGLVLAVFPPSVPNFDGAMAAPCVEINRVSDLRKIRANLDGDFCLTRDLDLGRIENFRPIGASGTPFTGSFDGRSHVIRI